MSVYVPTRPPSSSPAALLLFTRLTSFRRRPAAFSSLRVASCALGVAPRSAAQTSVRSNICHPDAGAYLVPLLIFRARPLIASGIVSGFFCIDSSCVAGLESELTSCLRRPLWPFPCSNVPCHCQPVARPLMTQLCLTFFRSCFSLSAFMPNFSCNIRERGQLGSPLDGGSAA